MKKHFYLKALFLCFYSKDFYREVLQNRKGLGFLHLFFINLIASLVISIILFNKVQTMDEKKLADEITYEMFEDAELTFEQNLNRVLDVIAQTPKVTFKKEFVYVDEKQPYYIQDPVTGKDLVIFDTTGYHNSLEGTDAVMLLTKTRIVTMKKKGVEQVHYISEMTREPDNEEGLNVMFDLISQIPKITINNGFASIEEEVPYYITNESGNPLMIIDTSGQYTSLAGQEAAILITKDKIILSPVVAALISSEESGEPLKEEIMISEINSDLIYHGLIYLFETVRSFVLWAVPLILFPLLVVISFVFTLVVVLMLAILTLIFGKMVKLVDFEYENALRVTSYAITPVFFANAFLPDMFERQNLVYMIISFAYMYFAVNVNSNKQETDNTVV